MTDIPDDATGKALKQFVDNGSDITAPMEMDFFVAVPSEKAGFKVAKHAQRLGFKTSVEQDGETHDWTCYCTKIIIPEYSEVKKIEEQLDIIAKMFRGYADGFGSYGNAEEI